MTSSSNMDVVATEDIIEPLDKDETPIGIDFITQHENNMCRSFADNIDQSLTHKDEISIEIDSMIQHENKTRSIHKDMELFDKDDIITKKHEKISDDTKQTKHDSKSI